jgi:hypothetical protein
VTDHQFSPDPVVVTDGPVFGLFSGSDELQAAVADKIVDCAIDGTTAWVKLFDASGAHLASIPLADPAFEVAEVYEMGKLTPTKFITSIDLPPPWEE